MIKKVLTIAGSDCSGGAGIQADIKTITAHKMYAMSVITALTAQNTLGVGGILDVDAKFVGKQIDSVFEDIRPDAVKIGMVRNSAIIHTIADRIEYYKADNVVIDPVMISTSNTRLLDEEARQAFIARLLPLGRLITPNLSEAEVLCGFDILEEEDMVKAAKAISQQVPGAILIKGGHLASDAVDVLLERGISYRFCSKRIMNPNTHGTGCTLSSAITCNLAERKSLVDSVQAAKKYLTGAIGAGLDFGKGSGPLNHTYRIK